MDNRRSAVRVSNWRILLVDRLLEKEEAPSAASLARGEDSAACQREPSSIKYLMTAW